MLRTHCQTSGVSLTEQDPYNNVVRTTIEALAAVLGGTQSLHTNAKDEASVIPTEESALLALRTQQIIAHESGVTAEADPLGGSYYVEALTDRLEQQAREELRRIDDLGGILEAIERGYVRQEIYRGACEHQRAVEAREKIIVGVNEYVGEPAARAKSRSTDPRVEPRRRRELAAFRKRRDAGKVEKCVATLGRAARGSENLMPPILDCVRSSVTLGEICTELRSVFGEHRPAGGV